MLKKEPVLEIPTDGPIRISKKQKEATADTTGELRVRLCMQRRALAFQLEHIATFMVLDSFISKLFALMIPKPIAGYRSVTLQQVIAADQALWQLVAQETRGQVVTSGDPKPIDKAVKEFMDSPEVSYHLLPMREFQKSESHDAKDIKKENEKKRKSVNDANRPPKASKVDIPEGCATKRIRIRTSALATVASHAWFVVQNAGAACMCAGAKVVLESTLTLIARKGGPNDRRRSRRKTLGFVFHPMNPALHVLTLVSLMRSMWTGINVFPKVQSLIFRIFPCSCHVSLID